MRYCIIFATLLVASFALSNAHAQTALSSEIDAGFEAPAEAPAIRAVRVEGNERIESKTVLTYLALREGARFEAEVIDKALKDLYATGFFADIKLLQDGDTLVVHVVENPVISEVSFEGNKNIKSEDLEKELELKSRAIYTKTKLQGDVKRILDIYRRSGRYTATVNPKIIRKDQNRLTLVFEISEGAVARIEHISFLGNNTFSSSSLESVVRSSETRWYQFLTDNDKYDPDRLQFDQELLRRFYTSQGYADFQVKSAHAELSPNKDAFFVTFVLDEGPKYKLSGVSVNSSLKSSEPIDLSKVMTTKAGDTFDNNKIEDSVDTMTKELGNLGYAFVDINPRLVRNTESKTIDLTYDIKPGPRVYVERINITGNVRTLDEVIRREFRISEGDPYNAAKLARTEQRINNLNFFEKVNITNEPGSSPDKTVVNVDVQEKSTGEINFGAGFSSTDGALADFGVKENNFLGRGQELRSRFTYAARRKQIDLGFTEPYFLNRELSAGFDIYKTVYDYSSESSYDLDSRGITLRTGYSPQEHWKHDINYAFRDNDITNVPTTASIYIQRQAGKRITSSVGQAFEYDGLNNRQDPTSGYYARLYQEAAGLGGDTRYLKHEFKTSYYVPITKNWVWNAVGSGGHVLGLAGEDIKIADRFFVGGDLVRGFRNSGIGPRDSATKDALGGNTYYAASTELKFPLGLPDDLGLAGAIFLDAGSLFSIDETGNNLVDAKTLRAGAGFGIAWKSPFGPIRVDIAQPILKEKLDEKETFRFSFGTRF